MVLYHDFGGSGGAPQHGKPLLGMRLVDIERHYEQNQHFFERSKQERIFMLTIRNKSHLLAFLVVLCQFAIIDTINMLPVGIMMYAIGLTMALEVWSTGTGDDDIVFFRQKNQFSDEKELWTRMQKEEDEKLRQEIEKATFEYHVLKNNPRTRIVPIHKNGKTVLYAI